MVAIFPHSALCIAVHWAETAYVLWAVISVQPPKRIRRLLLGLYREIHARQSSVDWPSLGNWKMSCLKNQFEVGSVKAPYNGNPRVYSQVEHVPLYIFFKFSDQYL